MRTGGFALFPLDGDGGIAQSAPELASVPPAESTHARREHPRSPFALRLLWMGAVPAARLPPGGAQG